MKKILIVDDNKDLMDLVPQILSLHGFEVCSHHSGIDVLRVVKGYQPDLILLDIRLGDTDGKEVCREVKKHFQIPVVLLSGDSDAGKTFSECDADGFIEKPFQVKNLVETVKSFINVNSEKRFSGY